MSDESGVTRESGPDYGGPRDADLEIGAKVGEYVVAAKIGAGGFGAVYRAEHPLIGKVVAIKVLGRKLSADPEMVSRFVAEARSVNQIGSRYIIDIFGFGELDDGRQYYVMELLDGMALDEYLEQTGVVGLGAAIPILRGIAKALDAAHANGIAHRDLKPENVYLVHDDQGMYRPKLLDFGIAKLMGEQAGTMHKTRTGAPIGTPFYMSPEQCRGKGVDHRTDIYAFGCMTYRMLTGVVPFDSDSYMDILFKQIQSEPEPPSRVNPKLPPRVDEAIAHMMAKSPDDRPASLASAVRELEQAAAQVGVEIPTGGPSGMVTPLPATSVAAPSVPVRPEGFSSMDMVAPTLDSDSMQPIAVPPNQRRGSTLVIAALAVLALVGGATAFFALDSGKDGESASAAQPEPDARSEVAPEPEPEPEPEPQPEPSPLINVKVIGVPDGTKITAPTGHFAIAPAAIQLPRGARTLSISLEAEGYHAATFEVTPDGDREVEVELEPVKSKAHTVRRKKKTSTRAKTGGGKDSIEDPFGDK